VFPVLSVLVVGIPATLYLQRIRLPSEEASAGVSALAGMRWRDFIHLVLDALIQRGYERTFDPTAVGEDGEYVLEREGQQFLLSSKHGAAYVLGSTAIAEFANAIRMRNLAGGLLVTPGQFAPEARPLARAQRIELLDGPTLWPELRPLLPEEQRELIAAPAQARTRQQVMLAWLVGLILGAVLFVLLHRQDEAAMPPVAEQATLPTTPAAPAAPAKAGTANVASSGQLDDDALQQRRKEVAGAISSLSSVDRAIWETQSTLLVHLVNEGSDPRPEICPLLERYDELAATRLQLQPPAGSTRPVRFVQCRAY
jgi:hypothetical protein